MADQLTAIDRVTARRLRRPSRTRSPPSSAPTVSSSRSQRLRGLGLDDEHAEFQAVETEMPRSSPPSATGSPRSEALRAHRGRLRRAGEERPHPEQKRLAWLYYTEFVRAGAKLSPSQEARVGRNQRLASLFTKFSQNVLADENDYVLFLETEKDLAGLPAAFRSSAAAAAEERGRKGSGRSRTPAPASSPFSPTRPPGPPREGLAHVRGRGDNGDAKDNNAIVTEILALRAERAKLLGYETHAHWRLENTMAKTPERAMALLEAVWTPRWPRPRGGRGHAGDRRQGGRRIKIAPWDYRYYAEKVRKAKYDLDENAVVPYLQLEKLREGMFWVAGRSSASTSPRPGRPVYHPDVASTR